jgi:hypothetical protein
MHNMLSAAHTLPDPGAPLSHTTSLGTRKSCTQQSTAQHSTPVSTPVSTPQHMGQMLLLGTALRLFALLHKIHMKHIKYM